jgi:hypothetical protein
VTNRAVRDVGGSQAYWLPAKQYQTDEFREAWDKIGRGDGVVTEAASKAPASSA